MRKYRINNLGNDALEPEESLLEAVSPDSRIERPINSGFFIFFYFSVLFVFLIFGFTGFNLSVFKNAYFSGLSVKNKLITIPVSPPRGLIYSKDGSLLAENRKTNSLWFLPSKLSGDFQELAVKLSEILGLPQESLLSLVSDNLNKASFLIDNNISEEEKEKLSSLNSPPLIVSENNSRVYPDGSIFSHIIGYVSLVNEDDLVKNTGYNINDRLGRAGLEKYYENDLRGQRGEILINRFENDIQVSEPEAGKNLVLNIDSSLQKKIYSELERASRGAGSGTGVAVAIDPRDGRVLALVSLPSYDNNDFVKGLSPEDYKLLFEGKKEPLLNRVISGRFAPGSTIKPLIALAALEEKVITPEKKINAPGFITIPSPYDPEIIYTFRDWKNHGWVNLREAIANSSDIYFYTVGGGFYDVKGLGIERIAEYLKLFEVDSILGIDLNGEAAGFVPTPEWKKDYRNQIWYQGDTFNVSIGQGDLLITPLWLAGFTGGLGTGAFYKPFILDKIMDQNGNVTKSSQPELIFEFPLSQENLRVVREGMKMAAKVGTAEVLADLPFEVGAKSGTAEVIKGQSTSSWITVFAPYDNPQIVLTIMIESGREGSYIPHQIAYRILKDYFSK